MSKAYPDDTKGKRSVPRGFLLSRPLRNPGSSKRSWPMNLVAGQWNVGPRWGRLSSSIGWMAYSNLSPPCKPLTFCMRVKVRFPARSQSSPSKVRPLPLSSRSYAAPKPVARI